MFAPSSAIGTTNLAYGGAEGRDLYITEADSGRILRARPPIPGHLLFSESRDTNQPRRNRFARRLL